MYGVVGLVFVSWEVGGIFVSLVAGNLQSESEGPATDFLLYIHISFGDGHFDKHSDVPAKHVSATSSPRQPGSREGTGASRFQV